MTTTEATRAEELREQIERAKTELKTLRSQDEIDRVRGEIGALYAELDRIDPPAAPEPSAPVERESERFDLAEPDAWSRFADVLNDGAAEVQHGPRERLAALRLKRSCIPDLPKNAARFAAVDLEISELTPLVEQEDRDIAEAAEAARVAAANTPEALAAAEIAGLEAKRSALALRILEGDTDARAEFDEVVAKIADEHHRVELRKFAAIERERLAREAERKAAEEAARIEAARVEFLQSERDTRMLAVTKAIAALRDVVRHLLEVDGQLVTSSDINKQGSDDVVAVLTMIGLQEAGINRRSIPYVPLNTERAQLLAIWPLPAPAPVHQPTTGRKCSVCTHNRRDEIERALANGKTATEVSDAFDGVSRHAVARHRDHDKEKAA